MALREIIFRGKRIDNGEWVEGFLCLKHFQDIPHSRYVIQYKTEYSAKEWRPDYMVAEVDPTTVGQYTGLKDTNGKRIFEGDIVKDDWGKTYEVFFTTKSCSFMVKLEHAPNEWEKGNYRLGDAWCSTICVIGNIHDNPELMDGGAENA